MEKSTKPVIFLDRDGTINIDHGYISEPERVDLIDGAAKAIKKLSEFYHVFVVTNQSGISRGFYTHEDVKKVNERLIELLAKEGAYFDDIIYCPHQKTDNCKCRKPETGMLEELLKRNNAIAEKCWMVGDRSSDIEAGAAIGARTILLPEPHDAPRLKIEPDFRAESLLDATGIILKEDKK
jgi:histidinol-phosphate phosphatase family protein